MLKTHRTAQASGGSPELWACPSLCLPGICGVQCKVLGGRRCDEGDLAVSLYLGCAHRSGRISCEIHFRELWPKTWSAEYAVALPGVIMQGMLQICSKLFLLIPVFLDSHVWS